MRIYYIAEQCRVVAGQLKALGLQAEERTGVWAANCPSWNLADVGTAMNRAATVGIYVNDSLDEVIYKINDAEIRYLFVDDPVRLESLLTVPPKDVPSLRNIITMGENPFSDSRILNFDDLTEPTQTNVEDRINLAPIARAIYTASTSPAVCARARS